MDLPSVLLATKIGLTIGAPVSAIVGGVFSVSTTTNSSVYSWAKAVGWLGAFPVACITGTIIAPHLVPYMGENVGMAFCAGYGYLTFWILIRMNLHPDSHAIELLRKWLDSLKVKKPQRPKTPPSIHLK